MLALVDHGGDSIWCQSLLRRVRVLSRVRVEWEVRRPLRSVKQPRARLVRAEGLLRHRHMRAHGFRVRELLGIHLPEIDHAAFLDSRHYVYYVAIEGLAIMLVDRIKGNWPGGYRLYGTGRNEGGTSLNTSGHATGRTWQSRLSRRPVSATQYSTRSATRRDGERIILLIPIRWLPAACRRCRTRRD